MLLSTETYFSHVRSKNRTQPSLIEIFYFKQKCKCHHQKYNFYKEVKFPHIKLEDFSNGEGKTVECKGLEEIQKRT